MGLRGKKNCWPRAKLPVGTIRLRRRDRGTVVRFIKVRDGLPKAGQWKPLARWTWEQHFGPVPRGKVVAHKDGNTLHDDLSNYALMTNGEVAQICHARDPAMSAANYRAAAAATAEHNRLRAQIRRGTRDWLPTRWYPVNDAQRVIVNDPWRIRWRMLQAYGAEVSRLKNGVVPKSLSCAYAAVKGSDLHESPYVGYGVRARAAAVAGQDLSAAPARRRA